MKLPQTFSALVVLLLIMIAPVHAEMVTRVVDGDAVDVRMPTGEIERIRLLCKAGVGRYAYGAGLPTSPASGISCNVLTKG